MKTPYYRTNKEIRTATSSPPHVLFRRMKRSGVVSRRRRVLTDSHIFRNPKFFREWAFFSQKRLLIVGYSYSSIIYRMLHFGWSPHKVNEFYHLARPYVVASYLSWHDIVDIPLDHRSSSPSTRVSWRLNHADIGYWHEIVILDPLRLESGGKPRKVEFGLVESRLADDQHEILRGLEVTDYEEQLKDPWYDRFHL